MRKDIHKKMDKLKLDIIDHIFKVGKIEESIRAIDCNLVRSISNIFHLNSII